MQQAKRIQEGWGKYKAEAGRPAQGRWPYRLMAGALGCLGCWPRRWVTRWWMGCLRGWPMGRRKGWRRGWRTALRQGRRSAAHWSLSQRPARITSRNFTGNKVLCFPLRKNGALERFPHLPPCCMPRIFVSIGSKKNTKQQYTNLSKKREDDSLQGRRLFAGIFLAMICFANDLLCFCSLPKIAYLCLGGEELLWAGVK